jgi:uncharacterized protein YjbI with pentapeptide repeats
MAKTISKRAKFNGKSFLLTGNFDHSLGDIKRLIQFEGGIIQKSASPALDFLLLGGATQKKTPDQKAVANLVAKGAKIEVLHETGFLQKSLIRSASEVVACLHTRDADVAVLWMSFTNMRRNLVGADLRKINVRDLSFYFNLSKANLSQATIRDLSARWMNNAKCDGLTASEVHVDETATGVSFRGASIGKLSIDKCPKADFTDAVIQHVDSLGGDFRNALFVRSVLRGAVLEFTDASGADFSHADLEGARCQESLFVKANFTQANLQNVNFKEARLVGADLRGANLRGARLVEANLSRAKVDGADFTGAVVKGAEWKGVDTTKAKGLVVGKK